MTACGSSTENIPTQISSEEEIEVVSTPTPLPEMPTETPETIDACLNCHADKQRLIDTTAPEEEVVEENKGAG